MRKEARSDFDAIAERLVPYSVRGETREKLNQLTEEFKQRLSNLESLTNGGRLSCPIHGNAEHVVITGNGRGDAKKFECRARHDPAATGRDDRVFRFNTYTSFEALKVYHDFLVEALSLLTMCEGTREGIAKYLNVSKHMVEFSTAVLLDYLGKEGRREKIEVGGDLVVVYTDFSTTRVSRAASVVLSRIGDVIAYQVSCAVNHMTAWNFVRALKERLVLKPGATVVFVTDGEKGLVDPVRVFFPGAVHIRQFHSESSRGLVYVHLKHRGKPYTVRFRWDAVLEEGEAGEEALRMRRRRKLERKEGKNRTELFDGVIVWEGVVYEPRGTRRKGGATVSGAMDAEGGRVPDGPAGNGLQRVSGAEMEGFGTPAGVYRGRNWGIAPATDGAKRVFKGTLKEALRIPAVRRAHSVLVRVFGGRYITSNSVECIFNVKSSLRYHRTMKSGDALVHVILYLRTKLRRLSREEIRGFLANEVVTLERMGRVVVSRRGGSARSRSREARRVVLDACRECSPVVIHYQDWRGRRTRRMIEPLELWRDSYTGMLKLRGYCYLRGAERTFLLDRIVDAVPMDTNFSILE